MDDSAFETLAEATLERLAEQIEQALEDGDVELRGGILTVELEDGRQYVINKHMPNRQMWLSSPVSGAAHFVHDPQARVWRSTRGEAQLHSLLAAELSELTGHAVELD
ncbi:MAG TPA: iron donor protein CyaY [Alphaproteobacteria bacterium]|nr:iron donor protein CyaY [Alphaproteobacteria bacterium]